MPASTEILTLDAIDACERAGCVHHTRKWWSATLGISEQQLSRWANGTGERYLRASELARIVEVLGDVHPEHAIDLMREILRPAGLVVEPRPVAPPSGRTHARLQREAADVQSARAVADEDGRREPAEVRAELREAREVHAAAGDHVTALEQELADVERAAGVVGLPGIRANRNNRNGGG